MLNVFGEDPLSLISTGSRTFNEFDAGSIIAFQTKVFGGKIDGTMPVMYYIKITAPLTIWQIKRIH